MRAIRVSHNSDSAVCSQISSHQEKRHDEAVVTGNTRRHEREMRRENIRAISYSSSQHQALSDRLYIARNEEFHGCWCTCCQQGQRPWYKRPSGGTTDFQVITGVVERCFVWRQLSYQHYFYLCLGRVWPFQVADEMQEKNDLPNEIQENFSLFIMIQDPIIFPSQLLPQA